MKEDGFTIIEVIIFLAISSMLLTMALLGSGEMAKRARFSSTVDGFHSTLLRQFEEVASGVNTRQVACNAGTVGTDSCVILGRVIALSNTSPQITVYAVTGNPTTTIDTVYNGISASVPRIQDEKVFAGDLAWGATFLSMSRGSTAINSNPVRTASTPSRGTITAIAFLRDPQGSQIVPYYFYSAGTSVAQLQTGLTAAVVPSVVDRTSQTTAALCIENAADWSIGSRPLAAILFEQGSGSSIIDTNYQPTTGAAGVC